MHGVAHWGLTMQALVDNSLPQLDDVKVSVRRCVVCLAVQALLVDDIAGPLAGVMQCMFSNDAVPCIWGPRAELDVHAIHHIINATAWTFILMFVLLGPMQRAGDTKYCRNLRPRATAPCIRKIV